MKIRYWPMDRAAITTAYLDNEPLKDGTYVGTNKYTDEDVRVRWDEHKREWHEVPMENNNANQV